MNLITKDILKEQLSLLKSKRPLTNPDVRRLLQSSRHTGAVVPFSPFRKLVLRANIFSTIAEKGWPAFYITLNPNDLWSPLVKLQNSTDFTREELFTIFKNMSDNSIAESKWSSFVQQANGHNPVGCAEYFHTIVQLYIKWMIGFDEETRSFEKGIFGVVSDFFGVVEEQQRKQLHIHMLIWVKDLDDYEKIHLDLLNEQFRVPFLQYLDMIIAESESDIEVPPTNPTIWQCPELTEENILLEFKKQFKWIQSWVQRHNCSRFHCLKKQRKCRYNYPKPLVPLTTYDERSRKIHLKRNNEWLNAGCPPISLVGRFNNDIKFIPGLDKPQISRYLAYYISNYTSKHEATNMHLVDFISRKIADYEKYQPDTLEKANDLFVGLLIKTVNKFSACNNVGSVTAVSSLLGYNDHYCASYFTTINWKGWDVWLCKQMGSSYTLHTYTRLQSSSFYYKVLSNGIQNPSSTRPIQEDMPLVAFFEEYVYRSNELENLCLYEIEARYQFLSEFHENITDRYFECSSSLTNPRQGFKFCHKEREERFVPSLPGFNLKSNTHGVGTEAFARLMLLLFKPFRSHLDLCFLPFVNFRKSFSAFHQSLPLDDSRKRIIDNYIKDAEVAIEAANYDHPDNPLEPNQFFQTSSRGTIEWQIVRYHLSDPEGDVLPSDSISLELPTVSFQQTQSVFLQQMDLDHIRNPSVTTDNSTLYTSGESKTRAQWLSDINTYLSSQKTEKTCEIQWAAVKIFSKHVLDSLSGEDVVPLRMLVHGEGGTGKSFIINTMVGLLHYLGKRHFICVCAPTGKAAVNVGGDTIDGLFGLSRSGSSTGYANTANTTETSVPSSSPLLQAQYLIVDEISMVGKERLCDMHDKLSMNIGEAQQGNQIFGNKSFIFFGDFLQFPPVGKTCIISKSSFPVDEMGIPIMIPETRKNKMGTLVFRSITYMLELTQQKRQDDVQYLNLLRAVRNMQVTQHEIDYLNQHCRLDSFDSYTAEWLTSTPFVVSTNEEKQYWNSILVDKYSEFHNKNITTVDAVDWIQKELSNTTSNTHMTMIDLHNLKHRIIDNCLQFQLKLVLGMNLVVLENLHKHIGVVNGAEVILQKIHFDSNGMAIALEVEVPNQEFQVEGLPRNNIWILRKKTSESFRKLDGTKVTVQRHQFPVTEGFASTAHKKQGATLPRAVICLEKGQGVSSYVKLSRTKRASDTFIMGSLSLKHLAIKPPSGWGIFRSYLRNKISSSLEYASTIVEFPEL